MQSGVKDKISQFWIVQLIEKSKELNEKRIKQAGIENAAEKKKIKQEIEDELWEWVVQQPNLHNNTDCTTRLSPCVSKKAINLLNF